MSSFPTSIDDFDTAESRGIVRASHMNELRRAIENLEAQVGVTDSIVANSLRYKMNVINPSDGVLHLTPLAVAPGTPTEGDCYVNSTDHHFYCYLSGAWAQLD